MSFLNAVQAKDFEKAKEYTTEEGKQLLTMAASMSGSMGMDEEEIEFKITDTVVDGILQL